MDEQAWANNFLAKITLQNGDELVVPRVPVQFGSCEAPDLSLAPDLGVDAVEILTEIGYSKAQIDAFQGK
jgi:crotonobetainyl-CoA:carnitine CoA-transferase CaiB-like acyl-CoA transferase